MSPKQMMLIGLMTLGVSMAAEFTKAQFGAIALFAFAGGCVFGKGYGVWEERSRLPRPHPQEDKP